MELRRVLFRAQNETAWTWEHLALTRARPVYGSAASRSALKSIIDETLHMTRHLPAFIRDAVKMRGDIARHKPPSGPLAAKLVGGGLIDLEFLIHVTQFTHDVVFAPRLDDALADLVALGQIGGGSCWAGVL